MREESKRSVDLSLQSLVSSVRWSTLDRTTPIQVRTMTNRAHMLMQDEWTSGVWSEVGSGFRLSETQLRFFLSSHAQVHANSQHTDRGYLHKKSNRRLPRGSHVVHPFTRFISGQTCFSQTPLQLCENPVKYSDFMSSCFAAPPGKAQRSRREVRGS